MKPYKNMLVISELGQILANYTGKFDDADVSALKAANSALTTILINVDPPEEQCFYDKSAAMFYPLPKQPSSYHLFDYGVKLWIDSRSIGEIKVKKWEELKAARNMYEFGGFLFEGILYDSDQVSQGRILGAMLAGQSHTWTTADNSTIELTAEQLNSLYTALQIHVAVAHERGRIARVAVENATTKDQVEAIVF